MTIRLERTHDHRTIVVVNSIAGQVKEDITTVFDAAVQAALDKDAGRRAEELAAAKLKELRDAISEARATLEAVED